jgi:hypothetical protein
VPLTRKEEAIMMIKILIVVFAAFLGGSLTAQLANIFSSRCLHCGGRLVTNCNGSGKSCERCFQRAGARAPRASARA